jgi:mannose-6-phosphate isomerase
VQPGDVFLTPPGVVHAIGAGVLLYEIQQPSDVTYRLYDWGRDREMHVAQAQAVMRLDAEAQRVAPMPLDAARELLVTCPHFALERHALRDGTLPALPSSCRVLTLLDGALTLGDVALAAGQSAVLAAAAPDLPVRGSGVALIASVPPPDAAR